MTKIVEIDKPAWNEEFRVMEFRRTDGTGQLNDDETVTAVEIVVTDWRSSADVTADMVDNVGIHGPTSIRYRLRGGTRGAAFLMEVRITTSNGQKLTEYRQVNII